MHALPDISQLHFNELHALRNAIDERLNTLRETGLAELRARFEEQAASFGLTAAIVINGAPRKVRKPRAAPKEE